MKELLGDHSDASDVKATVFSPCVIVNVYSVDNHATLASFLGGEHFLNVFDLKRAFLADNNGAFVLVLVANGRTLEDSLDDTGFGDNGDGGLCYCLHGYILV